MRGWFLGETYRGYAPQAVAERTINLFPQTITLPNSKTRLILVNVPGKRAFATATGSGGKALFAQDGRCFAVVGNAFDEIHRDGTVTNRGSVATNSRPASIASNGIRGNQLLIVSGGLGYVYSLTTNTLTQITDPQFPADVIGCGYIDGYFLIWTADRFQISASLDGVNWGADVGQRVGAPERIVGALVDHEVLWLFGGLQTEVWYDSGAASFPFEPVPGVFLEQGLAAPFAITRVGDSLLWLVEDERGGRQVLRNQGYNAVPVSHEGIDAALSDLSSVADAVMWSYQIHGQTFAVVTVPSQAFTIQYDIKEQKWSELGYWNTTSGQWEADRALFHAYAFGKHLTLDRETSTIWELSMDVYADGTAPRRWLRIGPTVSDGGRQVFHQRFELDAQVGVGLATGQGSDPLVSLRYSDDAGQTWSSARTQSLGAIGQYSQRVLWDRLGASRQRVYELSGSDPVKTILHDVELQAAVGVH